MAAEARRRPRWIGPAVLTVLFALIFVALMSLGVWQLHRKAWKEALLARIAALQTAPPEPLAVVLNRAPPGAAHPGDEGARALDFTRVVASCDGLPARGVHLYGIRTDGPGWRQIAACRLPPGLPYATLLVDLGFERGAPMSPPRLQPVVLPARGASVVGVLRTPDPPSWTDGLAGAGAVDGGTDQWLRRDLPGMARALGAARPAPFMLELESPAAGPGLTPSPLPSDIPNHHLEYALTWFGMALALAGVYAAGVVRTLGKR